MNDQWYTERNKRTDALAGVNDHYKNVCIAVVVTDNLQQWITQVMLMTTVNILSRWCRHIIVNAQDATNVIKPHAKDGATILQAIHQVALANDPHIDVAINDISRKPELTIFIGQPPQTQEDPFVCMGAEGWIAVCSYNQPIPNNTQRTETINPLSACFAACLANAQAFRWAIGVQADSYVKWYSLLDYSVYDAPTQQNMPFNQHIKLHRAHIIGCGAIGSSFCYLLSLTDWTGTITLADMDKAVELHNSSSSLLFNDNHAASQMLKTSVCKTHLANNHFQVQEFPDEYSKYDYDHEDPEKSADVILCFANDKNIWSTIQHIYPPVVFHATTSTSWGINVGRHIPLIDECIFCTFKELMKTIYIPKCGEGGMPGVPKQEEKPSAILPFLSPAAAILAMVEMYKLYEQQMGMENTLQLNLSSANGEFVSDFAVPGNCPVCRDQNKTLYKKWNSHTFFSRLSTIQDH